MSSRDHPFVMLIYYVTLPLFLKELRDVRKFQKAKKEFEAWFIRTQTEFWKSLTGKQLEHEFASVRKY